MSWEDLELMAPGSAIEHTIKCDYCKQVITQPANWIVYKSDFDDTQFCSYNCRCKYYKEHENERNKYFQDKDDKIMGRRPKTSKISKKSTKKPISKPKTYDVYSKFNLEKHKQTFIDYLEVCILPDGTVEYAVPSHQEYIINYLVKTKNMTREALMSIPYIDTNMLSNISGICQVWSNHLIIPNTPTYEQIKIINKFIDEKLLWMRKE